MRTTQLSKAVRLVNATLNSSCESVHGRTASTMTVKQTNQAFKDAKRKQESKQNES